MKRAVSLFLTIVMLLGCIPTVFAEEVAPREINADTGWSYLDDGTDPAGDTSAAGYLRTSWTMAGYDASSWKTAKGSFGAKKGQDTGIGDDYPINTLLSQYKEDGSTDKEAFFFRTTVNVEDADAVKQIIGSVIYDDSATVYING